MIPVRHCGLDLVYVIAGLTRHLIKAGIAGRTRNDGEEPAMTQGPQEIRAGRKAAGPDVKGFNLQGRRLVVFTSVEFINCPSICYRADENFSRIDSDAVYITF